MIEFIVFSWRGTNVVEEYEISDVYKYEDIIKAAKTGNLIIFVGAGVSRLLDSPSWDGYALEMLTDAVEKGFIFLRNLF
ncbi:hypothetical protein [Bacillus thuringiensis]|uniref:hypothetical protein n=1 Tax=Bacillus thuringiensis TaxID=1428 RepID=UPI001593D5AC|nr:hypothetical protein [Bacillus thuringiensis]